MKKILSFVLVLSLVLGSFSMAFAATPATAGTGLSDIKGNANEDAIQVAYDLGIVTGNPDGTYLPAKTVSRAEFAAMITRALAVPESALTAKTSKFKDTNGYGWAVPYLAFCESKGIMLGDGNGNAMPGRTVTVNEAMTMVLRAIGYTANSAELTGTWPANYVTVAQNNSLYDDLAKNLVTVDKANAAQIIYNALTVQKVSVNSDGKTDKLTITDPSNKANKLEATLMNTGLDCTQKDDYVVSGTDYDNTVINVTKYMGASGTVYLNNDDDIVAFTPDSVALTGSFNADKFKANGVEYTIGTKVNNTTPTCIVNTNIVTAVTASAIKDKVAEMEKSSDSDVTINVDLSGKTINQVYSIVSWKATARDKVAATDLDDLKDKNPSLLGDKFKKNDDAVLDTNSFALVGVASLDKMAKDNIVYVYADKDKNIRQVAVGTETAKGKITEKDNSSDPYVIVNAKKYEPAEFAVNGFNDTKDLPDLDEDAVLYLDAFGNVYDFDGNGGVSDKYGIIDTFVTPAGVDNAKAKIYTMDDATKTFTFDNWKDLKWTTTPGASATKNASISSITKKLVGYDLNSDGQIKSMDISAKSSIDAELQSTKILKLNGTTPSYINIDKDVKVFTYEGTYAAATDFDLAKITDIDLTKKVVATTTNAIEYVQNSDGDIVAMFVNSDYTDGTDDNIFAVLNSVTSAKNGSDDVQKLTGLAGGKDYSKITTDDGVVGYDNSAANIGLWILKPNGSGEVKTAELLKNAGQNFENKAGNETCIVGGKVITDVNSDRDVITTADGKFSIASDAVVYKAVMKSSNTKVDYYEVAKLSTIRKNTKIWLFDTKTGKDQNGIANVVIIQEDFN